MVEHNDEIGVSGSNKVLMSLEDEEAGAKDQERRLKRRRTCQLGYEQREGEQLIEPSKTRDKAATMLQISCLPIDVLYCVLDKLLELVDYVRFAAVCKELHFVAKYYNHTKQRWLSKPQLLPMLMLPTSESDNGSSSDPQTKQRPLYSVSERKIYNNIKIGLSVPYNENFCGSSQGWLASAHKSIEEWQEKRKLKVIHEITLRNPFGKASEAIHLPPYVHCIPTFYHHVKEWIPRVILSANPALHPENYYVLLAFYRPLPNRIPRLGSDYSPPLALIKGGQESWITTNRLPVGLPDDAIFYKNNVYLLLERGYYNMVTVEVNSGNLLPPKVDYIRFKPRPTHIFPAHCWEQYLVESTNEDLLLVRRFYAFNKTSFGVCKIVFNEEDDSNYEGTSTAQLVEVNCIGDDAIFLGQSQSQSVLASSIPGCKPNCIYYATESVRRIESKCDYLRSEMGIFNLGDRTTTQLLDSDSINNWNWNKMNMPLWILPSLNVPLGS
ncbi:uncharacterized protein LOC133730362 [Rosa rugosa]|uniref:uncharacterized protein LOC133730362 n=1 Tax=Rosa rugosa TaxID=74645 RepID=UPI002B403EC7|nr:uncharacterized protein LOC133730362 [Rosa rugosa]